MALQLIDNVHVLHPLSVAVDAEHTGVSLAVGREFPPQQAVVDGVLHRGSDLVSAEQAASKEGGGQIARRWSEANTQTAARRISR